MYKHVLSSHARTVYMYSVWNVERSWPGFENEGRERKMTEKQPQRRSANYDNRCLAFPTCVVIPSLNHTPKMLTELQV